MMNLVLKNVNFSSNLIDNLLQNFELENNDRLTL